MKRCCFQAQWASVIVQPRALACDGGVAHLQSAEHRSVWSTVEAPSGEHILPLRLLSFSMQEKATHGVLQSHSKPPPCQTKRDQIICAWWMWISLTVEISVSCQLWESIYFILHATLGWGARRSYQHAFVKLTDYYRKKMLVSFLSWMPGSVRKTS